VRDALCVAQVELRDGRHKKQRDQEFLQHPV
jgi:hypothetical protein